MAQVATTSTTTFVVNTMALHTFAERHSVPADGQMNIDVMVEPRGAWYKTGCIGFQKLAVSPVCYVTTDAAIFELLTRQWHTERGAASSITEIAMCRSYLRIIAMGASAVPLILRRMAQEGNEPDMWFVALQMLTGADPVTDEIRGDFKAMADRWLEWATQNGYAW